MSLIDRVKSDTPSDNVISSKFVYKNLKFGGQSINLLRLRVWMAAMVLLFAHSVPVAHAETELIDLKSLAKRARPAVMLLIVSDADGNGIATGTGFLISATGELITNNHVVKDGASVIAKAENGSTFPVEVMAADSKHDIAVLKLEGKDFPFLTTGISKNVETGSRIAVIGSPLGLEGTLSEGIVSAQRLSAGEMRILQITAAISPGSS
jgi:serine protease Do